MIANVGLFVNGLTIPIAGKKKENRLLIFVVFFFFFLFANKIQRPIKVQYVYFSKWYYSFALWEFLLCTFSSFSMYVFNRLETNSHSPINYWSWHSFATLDHYIEQKTRAIFNALSVYVLFFFFFDIMNNFKRLVNDICFNHKWMLKKWLVYLFSLCFISIVIQCSKLW